MLETVNFVVCRCVTCGEEFSSEAEGYEHARETLIAAREAGRDDSSHIINVWREKIDLNEDI